MVSTKGKTHTLIKAHLTTDQISHRFQTTQTQIYRRGITVFLDFSNLTSGSVFKHNGIEISLLISLQSALPI